MKTLAGKAEHFGRLIGWALALAFVVAWYFLAQLAIEHFFQVRPWDGAYPRDLAAHLVLGALLYGMARSPTRFMLAAGALFTALTASNAAKLSMLGAPIMPDDFQAARNMFLLLHGWLLVGAALLVAVPLLLLAWMPDWRRGWTWANLGAIGLAVALVAHWPGEVAAALDRHLGHSVWNQPDNYRNRGLPIHLLQETARARARRVAPPSPEAVADALAVLGAARPAALVGTADADASGGLPRRNLHMIVLESFWDPTVLKASALTADPLAPEFRALWAATGHSRLLAPVFGGYTANTEFEALCGFPVTQDNVYFETALRRDAPCLPAHLAQAGYWSIASHPNAASFWNRVNAYRRIGFGTYLADRDFQLDDMNGVFLSDASLYRQVMARLAPELRAGRPVFNYILTYFGHLPYPLNERRPPVIGAADGHGTVAAFANNLHYKSRELMDFLDELRAADPEALIVLFGDHLPVLEPNFGGYTESGLLGRHRGEFEDAMFRTLVETPLAVIDGKRGPIEVGTVSAHALPALLLELLGDRRPGILDLAAPRGGTPPIRPLPGLHFSLVGDGIRVCRDDAPNQPGDPECAASARWVRAVETLRDDLFAGGQHALLGTPPVGEGNGLLASPPGASRRDAI